MSHSQRIALTRAEVGEMIELQIDLGHPNNAIALAVTYEGALRASEACALRAEDVDIQDGQIRLFIRRSQWFKNDQGKWVSGTWVPLEMGEGAPFNAPALLLDWMRTQNLSEGFLFGPMRRGKLTGAPLNKRAFSRMLKASAASLCVNPIVSPQNVGTYSLRAGWATAEMGLGRSDEAVANHLRMADPAMLYLYFLPRVQRWDLVDVSGPGSVS